MLRPLALFALLLVAAPALAQAAAAPPSTAPASTGSHLGFASWVGPDASTVGDAQPGANGTAWFGLRSVDNVSANASRFALIELSSLHFVFANASLNVTLPNSTEWVIANTTFAVSASAPADPTFNVTARMYETVGNETTLLDTFGASAPVRVVVSPPVGPLVPRSWLIGGGALLALAVVVGAYSARQRSLRRRMRGEVRSQTMRELELEHKLERVEEKDPEQAAQIRQEIRAEQVVREKRRELQILEAKRADILKNLDLLKKRHDMGGLSKLQYDNMVAKRQADLARIEADIAQMEREGGGSAAA